MNRSDDHNSIGRQRLSWVVLFVLVIVGLVLSYKLTDLQHKMLESRARFDRAVTGGQAGLWEWENPTVEMDPLSKVWYSDRFAELLEYKSSEMTNNLAWFIGHLDPRDEPLLRQRIVQTIQNGEVFTVNYRLRTKSGKIKWFSAKGVPFYDQNKEINFMSGSLRDVDTEVLSKLRLERLINTAPIAIILCNESKRVSEYNTTAEKMFGWTRKEMIGQPIDRLLSDLDQPKHDAAINAKITEYRKLDDSENASITRTITGEGKRKSGESFPVELRLRAYKYGELIEFAAVLKDLTANENQP